MSTHSTQPVGVRGMRTAEVMFAVVAALVAGAAAAGMFPDDPTAAVFGIPVAIAVFIAISAAAAAVRRRYLGGSR